MHKISACFNALFLHSTKLCARVIILLFFTSCIKEEFDPDSISKQIKIQPAVAVPIGYINLTLDKYLADSLRPEQLTVDSSGFFTLLYHQNVYSLRADELLTFNTPLAQSGSFSNTTGFDIDLNLIPSALIYTDTLLLDLKFDSPNGERIDSILIENANIDLSVTSNYNISGNLKITIPQLTKNGAEYSKTTTINGFNSTAQIVDYKLSPLFKNDSNLVELIVEATVQKSNANILDGTKFLDYNISLSGINYSVIYGYLGQPTITLPEQSFDLPFFEKILEGNFHFEEPQLSIRFQNSFGFPLSFSFLRFDAYTKNQGTMQVSGSRFPLTPNDKTILYPNLQQVGQTIADSLVLNPTNTNLFEVLEASPKQIIFEAQAQANKQNTLYNFITDSSKLETDVEIKLPMYGYASFLVVQDTMDFRLTDFYNPETQKIKKMSFTLNFVNSFPVEADAQIYFYDAQRNLLDSMFSEPFKLPGGEDFDGDGKTDPTLSETIIVEIDSTKLNKIENGYYLLNKAKVHTANSDKNPPENVKFYSDYALRADLGAIFEFEELNYNN